jgi:thiol:disulfide interchange protein
MKYIRRLSGIALVSVLTLNSGVAMARGLDQAPTPTSSAQAEPLQAEPLMMANNIFRRMIRFPRPVNQTNQAIIREQRRQEYERRKQERMQAYELRKQELEVARREATEQQRLEAERRQQYFESLSPEQKQAYLAEQRARREQADKVAALFIMMFLGGIGSSDGGSDAPKNDMCADYSPGTSSTSNGSGMSSGNPCR